MSKEVKNQKKTDIKAEVSKNFVSAMSSIPDFDPEKINKDRSNFHRIGKEKGHYITIDALYEAVNNLGLNANYVFVEGGSKSENVMREGVVTNNNNVSGNHNKISNITPVFQGDVNGTVSIAEKIVNGMPVKDRKEMKAYMNNMASEIEALKKTIDQCKKEIRTKERELKEKDKELNDKQKEIEEKNAKLIQTHEKLIKLMEKQK